MSDRVLCIGCTGIDYHLKARVDIAHRSSNPVASMRTIGGVAATVAKHLAHLGNDVWLLSAIGNDEAAKEIIEVLLHQRINTQAIVKLDIATARYYAIYDPLGELYIAASAMAINDEIDITTFEKHWCLWQDNDIVFLDTNFPSEVIAAIIEYAKETPVKLFIDPVSDLKSEKLPHNLTGVYLIKPNVSELAKMTGSNIIQNERDLDKAAHSLLKRGAQHVLVSLGADGIFLVSETVRYRAKAKPLKKLNHVNGAGDALLASIIHGIKNNKNIIDASEQAIDYVASVLSQS